MVESPASLQELVVEFIASNVDEVCTSRFSLDDNTNRLYFRDENAFCHQNVANLLFLTLDKKGLLDDLVLTLFDPAVLRLCQVVIHNSDNLTCKGLNVLKQHQIQSVDVKNLSKISIDELIGCFGEWTINNIQTLALSKCTFVSTITQVQSRGGTLSRKTFKGTLVPTKMHISLCKLKNLKALNLSGTELTSPALLNICSDLKKLTSLDISNCSKIESIECLRIRKNTLKSLNLYNLKVLRMEETRKVLVELKGLCHLDVSDNKNMQNPVDRLMPSCSIVPELLRNPDFGPSLTSIDISGQDQTKLDDLYFFLKLHPNLKFLGLMHTSLCLDAVFLDSHSFTVSGTWASGCTNTPPSYGTMRFLFCTTSSEPSLFKRAYQGERSHRLTAIVHHKANCCRPLNGREEGDLQWLSIKVEGYQSCVNVLLESSFHSIRSTVSMRELTPGFKFPQHPLYNLHA